MSTQDSSSDEEDIIPQEYAPSVESPRLTSPEDEIAELEAELAALEREEAEVFELENKLNRPNRPKKSSSSQGTQMITSRTVQSNQFSFPMKSTYFNIDLTVMGGLYPTEDFDY